MLIIELGLNDEIFEHVDETGRHRFFNATKLYLYAIERAERICAPLEPIARHLLTHGGIEDWKVARLCEPYLNVPSLGVHWPDGSTLIVDGNHRIVRWRRDGAVEFNLYRVRSLAECEPYLVEGLPDGIIAGGKGLSP
jgi:hypothetical protein